MLSSYNFGTKNCLFISDNLDRLLVICVFIISFIIMKFFVFKESTKQDEQKSQQTFEYLKSHQKEDEDFFFGNSNESASD